MFINGKTLHELEEADLLTLIGRDEDKSIDFKSYAYPYPAKDDPQEAKRVKDEVKAELCADISAFANADGGWIICGMNEVKGEATELVGISDINPEAEITRLSQVADNGIEPRIPGLQFLQVDMENGNKVIVIYIPRSFAAPHRVKATEKFHVRKSKHKMSMDLDELRRAFNLSQQWTDKIREFREERINLINDADWDDLFAPLSKGLAIVIHVIPLQFAEIGAQVDIATLLKNLGTGYGTYLSSSPYSHYNLDGFILPKLKNKEGRYSIYTQIFRNGVIEFVEVIGNESEIDDNECYFSIKQVEQICLEAFQELLHLCYSTQVTLPIAISVSLANAYDYHIVKNEIQVFYGAPKQLKSHMYLLPEIVLNTYGTDLAQFLKPIFDILWNIVGYPSSPNYDKQGNRKSSR